MSASPSPSPKSKQPFNSFDESEFAHPDEETWLVSYADMMTLLFGFFAMLFTFATFDDDGYVKIRKELAKFFGGTYINATVGREVSKDVKAQTDKIPLVSSSDLKMTEDGGMELSFITAITFQTGGSALTPEAEISLKTLADVIRQLSTGSKGLPQIRIEGHTDDIAISPLTKGPFKSNWELSAARAGVIAKYFETLGFPPETLSASGFGSARPAFPNRDPTGKPIPENQDRNRRVVIKVALPKSET